MTFVDELAVVGTNVGEISAILDAPELKRPTAEMKLNGLGIRLDHVSFAYKQEDGEVLHDVTTGKEKNRCRLGWFCALIPHVLRRF